MANLMDRCELCTYARKRSKESQWECRVNSPRIVPETGDEEATFWCGVWPVVNPDDWCGKFRETLPLKPEEITFEVKDKHERSAFTLIPRRKRQADK